MTGLTEIEPGAVEPILEDPREGQDYIAYVEGSRLRLGHEQRSARQDGQLVRPGDRLRLYDTLGKDVYGYNTGAETATVEVDAADLGLDFMARAVIGGVQTSATADAAPASDAFVHRSAIGADPSAGVVEQIDAPDRADFVVISVDDADGSFEVCVQFLDEDDNVITQRGPSNSSGYSGSSTADVLQRVAVAAPSIEVEITGSATSADYSIYAR